MILLLKNHWQHFPSPRDLLIFLICSFKLLLLMIHWLLSFRKLANWSSRLNAVFTTLTLRFQTTYSFFAFHRTAINQICIPLSLYIYNVNTWTSCIWTADRHECVYMIFEDQLLEQWRESALKFRLDQGWIRTLTSRWRWSALPVQLSGQMV